MSEGVVPIETSGAKKKSPGMIAYIDCRVDVDIEDGTSIEGRLATFDRHGNVVLVDAVRTRRIKDKAGKPKGRVERTCIDVVMLRGTSIISVRYTPGPTTGPRVPGSYEEARELEAQLRAAAAPPDLSKPLVNGSDKRV